MADVARASVRFEDDAFLDLIECVRREAADDSVDDAEGVLTNATTKCVRN